jgi:hypothetical protein
LKRTLLSVVALSCFISIAAAAEPARSVVLVGNYEALGVSPKQIAELEQALRTAMASRPVTLVSPEETDKVRRSLSQCAEDAACVGSAGERAGARWVLGFGAGKVGSSVLVSVIWVDVVLGKSVGSARRKVPPAAMVTAAKDLLTEALKGVVLEVPPEPPPTPPPSVLVPPVASSEPRTASAPAEAVVAAPSHGLRNAAIGAGVATAVFTASTVVLGVLAQSNYSQLVKTANADRGPAIKRQTNLNTGADASLGLALTAATTTVIFVLLNQMGRN